MKMGRKPCCEKIGLRRGKWDVEEDQKLINYINANGQGSWRSLPTNAGLLRCGKSCRLRWINYLKAGLKRGSFTPTEDETIVKFQNTFGNKWSLIASHLPGRTDNEIKNYWNSHLSRRTYMFRSTAMVDPKIKNLSKRKKNVNKSAAASARIKKNDTKTSPPVSDCTTASASSSSRTSTDNNGGGDERETGSGLHDDSSSLSRSTCMDDIIGWVNEFMLEEREAETNDEEMVAVWDENMLLQFESFLQDSGGGGGGDDQAAADCNNRPMMNDDERENVVINSCTANKAEKITNLLDEAEKDYGSNMRSCPSRIVIYFNDDEEFHCWDFGSGVGGGGDVLNMWSEADERKSC